MTIHPGQIREYIIRTTLRSLGLYSEAAEELLILTDDKYIYDDAEADN